LLVSLSGVSSGGAKGLAGEAGWLKEGRQATIRVKKMPHTQ